MVEVVRFVHAALARIVDVAIVVLIAAIGWIAITGGTTYTLWGARVSVRGVDNPLLLLAMACVGRYCIRTWSPFLGLRRWSLREVDAVAFTTLTYMGERLSALDRTRAVRAVAVIAAVSLLIKAAGAWSSPGFFSGDDVEIHEMSLGLLWNGAWPIWELRSPVFPLGVIFPFQWGANAVGLQDAQTLVIVGRSVVVVISTFAVFLTARAFGRTEQGVAVVAASLLAFNRLQLSFGSSELPRPVSTVFVLGAYLCLQGTPSIARAGIAGTLLGLAASLRFSEALFLVPALIALIIRRSFGAAIVCAFAATATGAVVVGVSDHLYWKSAFHSLAAITDYTLVKGLSSRGYQSPLWYVINVAQCTSIPVIALAAFGVSKRTIHPVLWVVCPLVLLSCLPHKEARYLIPVIPFIAILGAHGTVAFIDWSRRRLGQGRRPRIALCVVAVLLGFLQDLGHWRLPRTNDDVRFALALRRVVPEGATLVVEQVWRMGGHIYLPRYDLRDLDPNQLPVPGYLKSMVSVDSWVVLDERSEAPLVSGLTERGFHKVLSTRGSRLGLWKPSGASGGQ